jgi:hypothetical protein
MQTSGNAVPPLEAGRVRRRTLAATAAVLALARAASVSAQPVDEGGAEFALSIGYANLGLGSSSSLDSEDALRWEASLTFAPLSQLPQFRVGGDVGVSLVLDDTTTVFISRNGQTIFAGTSQVPLWTIEPELRLSWRQSFANGAVFVEPGVAGGVAFGFLSLNDDFGNSYDADSSTAFGRIFLRAGARVSGGLAGIEASYAVGGNMNFGGDASGDFRQFYIGIFGSLSF